MRFNDWKTIITGLVLLFGLIPAWGAAPEAEQVVRERFRVSFPNVKVTSISPSPVPGWYEVDAEGMVPAFVTADGRYMVSGEFLEFKGNKIIDIAAEAQQRQTRHELARVPAADMIIFSPKEKPQAVVYAFTDVDCGYCRKLHSEIDQINARGIEVRYLAWPRTGPQGMSAQKMAAVWCAQDKRAALTKAKRGEAIPPAPITCRAPIDAEFALGQALGVDGTPALFSESGKHLGGYLPPDSLAEALEIK